MFESKMSTILPLCLLMSVGCNDSNKSGTNTVDKQMLTVVPNNKLENSADATLVQKIRQEINAADSLSVSAKNVKIVSKQGYVTLKGPVETLQEKKYIGIKAEQIAGETKVDNKLEVSGN